MPERCHSCGQKFEPEPGFYYGAMYVGYALSVAYLVTLYVAASVLFGEFSLLWYFIVAIGSLFLLTPVVFRLSRSVWINFFVHYDPAAHEKWIAGEGKSQADISCREV